MSSRKTTITVASVTALAMAGTAVKQYEGYTPTVVPDKLANGRPTGGYGETVGVKLGETHSKKYWSDRLAKRLEEDYDAGIGRCIRVELPDGVRAMAISLSYNAGIQAVCKSPMVRRWNAGDVEGGCRAILTKGADGRYNGWRIGSRPQGPNGPFVIQPGLINRRAKERRECLAGANEHPAALVPVIVAAPAPPPSVPVQAPPPVAADAPKTPWWRSLLDWWHRVRVWCWIFKCEAGK